MSGRLDIKTTPEMETLIKLGDPGNGGLTLNLSDLKYISSVGLRAILATHKIIANHSGLTVRSSRDTLMEVLDATRFTYVLNIQQGVRMGVSKLTPTGQYNMNLHSKGPALAKFLEITKSLIGTNAELLMRIMGDNKDTKYGRKYGFVDIRTIKEYQARVLITTFDDYAEHICRMTEEEATSPQHKSSHILTSSSEEVLPGVLGRKSMIVGMEVGSDVDELNRVIGFVDGALEGIRASKKSVLQLELVVEKIFVNIASYDYYSQNGKVWISCDVNLDAMSMTIMFMDMGPEFDLLVTPDLDATLPAEDRRIDGLGILLVKNNIDRISYRCRDSAMCSRSKKIWLYALNNKQNDIVESFGIAGERNNVVDR